VVRADGSVIAAKNNRAVAGNPERGLKPGDSLSCQKNAKNRNPNWTTALRQHRSHFGSAGPSRT